MAAASTGTDSFSLPSGVSLADGPGGLPLLQVRTPQGSADILTHGAHVLRYQPAGHDDLLFVSRESHFAEEKAVRGGIPVIFPWFGPRAGHPELPAHGFARLCTWHVESVEGSPDGEVTIVFTLQGNGAPAWPYAFHLRYRVSIGARLTLSLEVENRSDESFTFEEALHTYFSVADAREVSIFGLQGAQYVDKAHGQEIRVQEDDLIWIREETDRVYLSTTGSCELSDPRMRRKISVAQEGSSTTVVWNPWINKAAALPDFGDDEWPSMVCIETANALDNTVSLAPGCKHVMKAIIEATSL